MMRDQDTGEFYPEPRQFICSRCREEFPDTSFDQTRDLCESCEAKISRQMEAAK